MSIVNLLLGFGLNFVCKETTEIHGNLNWSPQQWKKTQPCKSHSVPSVLCGYLQELFKSKSNLTLEL
jgi:hypothetical protein